MPPRASSANRQRSRGQPPIFAGVERQAPQAQRSHTSDGGLSLFGEQCRLFEGESGLAAELEAGQHLLPCFGDEGVTVDRFDARLLLPAAPVAARSSYAASEPDAEEEVELDAERYRDLRQESSEPSSGSDAEDAYLRLGGAAIPHDYGRSNAAPASSFQQVEYDYGDQQPEERTGRQSAAADASAERAAEQQGEPYVAPFAVPESLQANLPATMQQHKVIVQTAAFVREAGGQSEIRLGVAQASNPNFAFLRPEDRLFPYFRWLLQANPQESTPARSVSLQGPTGLDMLAASYDTDQASDPPTPRAEAQTPQGAGDGDTRAAAEKHTTAAAVANADGGDSAAATAAVAAAAQAAQAVQPAQEAAAPAEPGTIKPQHEGSATAAGAALQPPATLPAATQAIMTKLIDFVKIKGITIGLALQRRETANPRFSFLQPGDVLHAAWRAAAIEGLGADMAAQLLPAVPADETAAGEASSAADDAVEAQPDAADDSAHAATAGVSATAAADTAKAEPLVAGSSNGGSAAAVTAAPGGSTVMRAVYAAPAQTLTPEVPAPAAAAAPTGTPVAAAALAPVPTAALAASSKLVAVIRANPQLARRIVGPLPQPKPKAAVAKSTYASALAEFGSLAEAAAEATEQHPPAAVSAAAAGAGTQEHGAEASRAAGSPPPWLENREAAGSGSDSPGPAGEPAPQTPAEQQAAAKKARRLKAARMALAAKQRAEAEEQRAAELAVAEAAARAAAAAAKERRKQAEAAAAEARQRRRIFMGEEAEEPDAAARPPLLRKPLTSEELWACLQPSSAIGRLGNAAMTDSSVGGGGAALVASPAGSGALGGDSGALSQQQLGMSVGNIMARLRAAQAGEAAGPQPGGADRETTTSGAASTATLAPSAVERCTSPGPVSGGGNGDVNGGSRSSSSDRDDSRHKERQRRSEVSHHSRKDKQRGDSSEDRPKSSGSKRHRREESTGKRSKQKRSKH